MSKLLKAAAIALVSLTIAACSGDKDAPEADDVTETRMDEVDVIDGTISDDMVDVDTETAGDALVEGAEEGDGKDGEDSTENTDTNSEE